MQRICVVLLSAAVLLVAAKNPPTWPSEFSTGIDRLKAHNGELWTGKWYFSEKLNSDRFDLRETHLHSHRIQINRHDEGKSYLIEGEDKKTCTVTNLHSKLPVPNFSQYQFKGVASREGKKCDHWEYKTNATVFSFYDTETGSIPVSMERTHVKGEREINLFWHFDEAVQNPDVFDVSKVAPGVPCNPPAFVSHKGDKPASDIITADLDCAQMRSLSHQYFPAAYDTDMICISWYESSWRTDVYNNICCYGLWQINSNHLGEPGCPSNVNDLYNADDNAKCARHVLDTQGLNAWTTWASGDCRGWNKCDA